MSREIAEALVAIDGIGFAPTAPITLKSGINSPVYCDNRKFPFHPTQWAKVIHSFETHILEAPIRAEVIAGMEAAGIPHSAALGFALRTPSVFVRKEAKGYGAKKRVEGGDVAGKYTVLIEDLVTTGSSSLSGVEALRAEGAFVADCLSIISYGFAEGIQNFAASGVRLHTLTNFSEVLEVAMEQGKINTNEAATVQDWLRDPHGWAARNGFE